MNKKETAKFLTLAKSFYENIEINEGHVNLWHSLIGHLDAELASKAFKLTIQEHQYSKLKPSDVLLRAKRLSPRELPKSLTMSSQSALLDKTSLLAKEASAFADRLVPPLRDTEQFTCPEELAKNQKINKAMWAKEFKARFEDLQSRAMVKVDSGQEPKLGEAIMASLLK